MLDEVKNYKRNQNLLFFLSLGGVIAILLGFGLMSQAFAYNGTAITEALDDLQPNASVSGNFHIIWFVLLGGLLAVFMGISFRMRQSKETSFFTIASVIMSIALTLILLSPVDFDIIQETTTIQVTSLTTGIDSAIVEKVVNQTVIIPYDSDMRFVLTALLTGVSLFNGLYTIFILTDFKLTSRHKQSNY